MNIEIFRNEFDMGLFDQMSALFGSYFPLEDKLLDRNYTQWLYVDNPFGRACIVIAVESGRWVGFMALIPVELVKKDLRLVAYYVVNVLVHPQFQGKHIFGRMIAEAKKLVTSENAALMGHPNALALKAWQRAGMHFHEALQPNLIFPRLFSSRMRTTEVTDIGQLQPVLSKFHAQNEQTECCEIAVSDEYINWRYLCHPTNIYRVQLVKVDNDAVGFVITKRVRPGVSLLLDAFMLDRYFADGLGCLPWFTVAFMPMSLTKEFRGSLWSLPLKKQIPFFLTHYQQPFTDHDVINIGLSASDF